MATNSVFIHQIFKSRHVYVIHGENVAKIWLKSLDVEYNRGYNKPELNKIVRLARENQEKLLEV